MSGRHFKRFSAVFGCVALLISLLMIFTVPASAATWKKEADSGIGSTDDWHLASGPVFKGNLIVYSAAFLGIHGPAGAGMYTFDGDSFTQVGSLGFGNPNNRSLLGTVVYRDKLYIGTGNGIDGCELYTWDGNGNPQLIVNNGFGEGAANDTCIPLAVINDELYVSLSNRPNMPGTGGMRLYKFDGTTWTKLMGTGMPVTGGFGNQENEACAFASVWDGKLVMPALNTTTGMEVWTYDGANFNRIGRAGDAGLWSGNQVGGIAQLSALENKVYLGTSDGSGTEGGELYTYGSGGWTQLSSGGLGGGVNDSILQPFVKGSELYVATLTDPSGSLTNTSRVYRRNGGAFEPISDVGLGDGNNWGIYVSSYQAELIATTLNFNGGQVWSSPLGPSTYYFAEGYTGPGFQEYICLGNPGEDATSATITYMFLDGSTQDQNVDIPAKSRTTVNVNDMVGFDRQVSARVTSPGSIVAERPMYFEYAGPGTYWTGGHDTVGAVAPSDVWYFAEGYTGPGFDEWVCVLNPGDDVADLTFRFQTQEVGEIVVGDRSVSAHSRSTFKVNDLLGGGDYQTSLKLESSSPVVAERPMYFSYQGTVGWNWTGGHCVMGVPSLSRSYYFAEGTTRSGFEEWITLQNPNPYPIEITATFQLGQGDVNPDPFVYEVAANYRRTIFVPDYIGTGKDASVLLTCPQDFLAERPMYFSYSYGVQAPGGHCVIGAPSPAYYWFLAEGYTGPGFDEWICLQNPGDSEATVTVTYYTQEQGALDPVTLKVAPKTRETIMVNASAGADFQLSAGISSTEPIVVERPMYFNSSKWAGGHDVVGYIP